MGLAIPAGRKTPLRAGVPNKGTVEVAPGAGKAARGAGEPPGAPGVRGPRALGGRISPPPPRRLCQWLGRKREWRARGRGVVGRRGLLLVGKSNPSIYKQKGCLRKEENPCFSHTH